MKSCSIVVQNIISLNLEEYMAETVWLVFYGMAFDGYSVIGVFSSEEKANEHAAKQEVDKLTRVFVEEWKINTTKDPYV